MAGEACHVDAGPDAREAAKRLILKVLGVQRVASWCGVKDPTIYQWLSRGTDEEPIPPGQLPKIVAGAVSAGVVFDPADLWPGLAAVVDMRNEQLRLARAH